MFKSPVLFCKVTGAQQLFGSTLLGAAKETRRIQAVIIVVHRSPHRPYKSQRLRLNADYFIRPLHPTTSTDRNIRWTSSKSFFTINQRRFDWLIVRFPSIPRKVPENTWASYRFRLSLFTQRVYLSRSTILLSLLEAKSPISICPDWCSQCLLTARRLEPSCRWAIRVILDIILDIVDFWLAQRSASTRSVPARARRKSLRNQFRFVIDSDWHLIAAQAWQPRDRETNLI